MDVLSESQRGAIEIVEGDIAVTLSDIAALAHGGCSKRCANGSGKLATIRNIVVAIIESGEAVSSRLTDTTNANDTRSNVLKNVALIVASVAIEGVIFGVDHATSSRRIVAKTEAIIAKDDLAETSTALLRESLLQITGLVATTAVGRVSVDVNLATVCV